MKRGVIVAALACALSGSATAAERCVRNPGDHYDEGVAFQLAQMGIAHRFAPETGVCVAEPLAPQLDEAMRRLDRYFWKVDHALSDACEERAYVEWARARHLRFDVSTVVDLGGNAVGRVFRLRSYSEEELRSNRRALEEAPRDAACEPTAVG